MKSVFVALMVVIPSSIALADSSCTGVDAETGAYVFGQCTDSELMALDSTTGAPVVGNCQDGDSSDDVDAQTGALVILSCQ